MAQAASDHMEKTLSIIMPPRVLRKLANVQKELYAFLGFGLPNLFKISSQIVCVTLNLEFRKLWEEI